MESINPNKFMLLTLDKKLFITSHRLSRQQMNEIMTSGKVDLATVETEIKKQLLFKFLDVVKNLKIDKREEDDNVTYSVRGFVLSERQLYETLLEVTELDTQERDRLKAAMRNALGMF